MRSVPCWLLRAFAVATALTFAVLAGTTASSADVFEETRTVELTEDDQAARAGAVAPVTELPTEQGSVAADSPTAEATTAVADRSGWMADVPDVARRTTVSLTSLPTGVAIAAAAAGFLLHRRRSQHWAQVL